MGMTVEDFRRLALTFRGVEESSHMGAPDFRVGGRIFATLASQDKGYGNVKLTPEQQETFVTEMPDVFVPVAGGWGRMGMTHVRLGAASESALRGALEAAWRLRIQRNEGQRRKTSAAPRRGKKTARKTIDK